MSQYTKKFLARCGVGPMAHLAFLVAAFQGAQVSERGRFLNEKRGQAHHCSKRQLKAPKLGR